MPSRRASPNPHIICSAYGLKGRTIKWRILITHTLITKRLKQWRLLPDELYSHEQYDQYLELVKTDLEERKQLFFGRPAFLYWSVCTENRSVLQVLFRNIDSRCYSTVYYNIKAIELETKQDPY